MRKYMRNIATIVSLVYNNNPMVAGSYKNYIKWYDNCYMLYVRMFMNRYIKPFKYSQKTNDTRDKGFTLMEILVAIFIITIGVLGLSQMQFLSLSQYQNAEDGTAATNIIQYISDRDISEVKRRSLLNNAVYLDYLSSRTPNFDYCDGTDKICEDCPCDPFTAITASTDDGDTEASCSAINLDDFDAINITFFTDATQCGSADYIALKFTSTSIVTTLGLPDAVTIDVQYAVKSRNQFADTGLDTGSFNIRDTLAIQDFRYTATIQDYTSVVQGGGVVGDWSSVRLVHVP